MATKEEINKIIADRLQERLGGQRPCAVCAETNWIVGEPVSVTIQNDPGKTSLGGVNYPLITLICSSCGNTHFLNSRILGFESSELKYERTPVENKNDEE